MPWRSSWQSVSASVETAVHTAGSTREAPTLRPWHGRPGWVSIAKEKTGPLTKENWSCDRLQWTKNSIPEASDARCDGRAIQFACRLRLRVLQTSGARFRGDGERTHLPSALDK